MYLSGVVLELMDNPTTTHVSGVFRAGLPPIMPDRKRPIDHEGAIQVSIRLN
jgi:hypothetical protein